jgi:membrane protein implicated in regulation of membrane protease activity
VAAFAVGGIALLVTLLLGDFEGGGHDVGHDGLPFLSLTSLSAAILGAGTGGLLSTWAGLGALGAGLVALGSAAVLVLVLQGVLMPYLRRQQSNSQRGRASYIGLLGTVTLEIPAEGWGEVSFADADGNRVRARAVTAEPEALLKSTRIYIADVDAEYVHVVAVPEDPAVPDLKGKP